MAGLPTPPPADQVLADVHRALAEDIGVGDATAQLLPDVPAQAWVVAKEAGVVAGRPWFDACFRALDPEMRLDWRIAEGDTVAAGTVVVTLAGRTRAIVSAERPALNFLQTLSATATATARYVAAVAGTRTRILDTRKTLPGLRLAQKYAVTCGGCDNHRIGLYDAFLIKENHIAACGGIAQAVAQARHIAPGKPVEVEVEDLQELQQALAAGADIIMLDELSDADMREAVRLCGGRAKLEASGGIHGGNLRSVAETGVDYISLGTLTKDIKAVDLSLRLLAD